MKNIIQTALSAYSRSVITRGIRVNTALILVLTMSLSACGKTTPSQAGPHPVLVTTAHNVSGEYARTFTAIVKARHESVQGFRVGGKVVARMVEVAQTVVAGQPLARLDPSDYQLAVQAANNQLQAAQADAVQAAADEFRLRRLLAEHSVSADVHERQKAQADAAVARQAQASRQLDIARNREKYTTLTAGLDGIITSINFETGQVVAEGQPIVTIADPSELEVVADLPEDMATSAHAFSASATFWGSPDLAVPLKLRELSPAAAARTRTFRVRFSIQDKSPVIQQSLHLGMTANLHLARKDGEQAAVLPATAIWKTDAQAMVWQVDKAEGKLVAQAVEVLRYTNEAVLVRGVTDGTQVVSAGIQKLTPGMAVVPVERSASGLNLGIPPSAEVGQL